MRLLTCLFGLSHQERFHSRLPPLTAPSNLFPFKLLFIELLTPAFFLSFNWFLRANTFFSSSDDNLAVFHDLKCSGLSAFSSIFTTSVVWMSL